MNSTSKLKNSKFRKKKIKMQKIIKHPYAEKIIEAFSERIERRRQLGRCRSLEFLFSFELNNVFAGFKQLCVSRGGLVGESKNPKGEKLGF